MFPVHLSNPTFIGHPSAKYVRKGNSPYKLSLPTKCLNPLWPFISGSFFPLNFWKPFGRRFGIVASHFPPFTHLRLSKPLFVAFCHANKNVSSQKPSSLAN